jgi:F0F1-type ATP synthase assembly protein I
MTNHFVTGAIIALVVGEPLAALPLAFLSHFVLDTLPHYGEREAEDEYTRSRLSWSIVIIDAALGVSFAVWLLANQYFLLLAGALAAFLPDVVWMYRLVRYKLTDYMKPRNRFSRFHERIQREYEWGVLIELVYLVCAMILFNQLVAMR